MMKKSFSHAPSIHHVSMFMYMHILGIDTKYVIEFGAPPPGAYFTFFYTGTMSYCFKYNMALSAPKSYMLG